MNFIPELLNLNSVLISQNMIPEHQCISTTINKVIYTSTIKL